MKTIVRLGIAASLAAALPVMANGVTQLGFEGMQLPDEKGVLTEVLVDNFYADGSSKRISDGQPVVHGGAANNFGVTFDRTAWGLTSTIEGKGTGPFGPRYLNEQPDDPSNPPATGNGSLLKNLGVAAMLVTGDVGALAAGDAGSIMNVPKGLTGLLSFFYASQAPLTTVALFEDVGGAGDEIVSATFLPTPVCVLEIGDESDPFCAWSPGAIQIPAGRTAHSVRFAGVAFETYFDNITFGNGTPAPEPGSFALAALGLLGVGAAARRQQRRR